MSQNDPKATSLNDVTHKKSAPPTNNFFRVQSRRLADPFVVWAIEQLSSAIGRGSRALVRQPKTAVF